MLLSSLEGILSVWCLVGLPGYVVRERAGSVFDDKLQCWIFLAALQGRARAADTRHINVSRLVISIEPF